MIACEPIIAFTRPNLRLCCLLHDRVIAVYDRAVYTLHACVILVYSLDNDTTMGLFVGLFDLIPFLTY